MNRAQYPYSVAHWIATEMIFRAVRVRERESKRLMVVAWFACYVSNYCSFMVAVCVWRLCVGGVLCPLLDVVFSLVLQSIRIIVCAVIRVTQNVWESSGYDCMWYLSSTVSLPNRFFPLLSLLFHSSLCCLVSRVSDFNLIVMDPPWENRSAIRGHK